MAGTIIRERTQRTRRQRPTDTGVFFLAGPAQRGRKGEVELCKNMADVEKKVGGRINTSLAWDIIDSFFGEGGSTLYFSRVVGPAAAKASRNLLDAGGGVSLIARAVSEGDWAHAYSLGMVAGDAAGEFKVRLTGPNALDETSPSFATQAEAISWAESHDIFRLELGATALDPAVVAPAAFAGGTDDIVNATDQSWADALLAFKRDLGPGQVAYAGRTTTTAHTQLRSHALVNNRRALFDTADTQVKATVLAAIAALNNTTDSRVGAMFWPWVELPALTPGASARPVPPSGIVAGVIARNDGSGVSPNKPSGGDLGILQYATGLRTNTQFSEQDFTDLESSSVNALRDRAGNLKIFGYRSAVKKTVDPINYQFGNMRLYMAIAAKADNVLENFVLREIDGRGLVFRELEGALKAILLPYHTVGSLYGEDPDDAYSIDVETVNTRDTIRANEIHAAIELTMSPSGETVILDFIKRQL